jgi:hypothetical protein
MYGLSGERQLTEWEVPWLPGYQGATPGMPLWCSPLVATTSR